MPGYQATELLYESSRTLIYRGLRSIDRQPIVLKQLKPDCVSPEAVAQFHAEYELIRRLNLAGAAGVIQVYGLEFCDRAWTIETEDFGAESLDRYLSNCSLTLVELLQLAIQVAAILGEVHQQRMIHHDLNPSNLLMNPTTQQVKLIDFGMAIDLDSEPQSGPSTGSASRLAYLSPEQTGRINHPVDQRSDFYALGVTLYQLLSDRLPFAATDPLELVDCHSAQQPIPLHQIKPEIPRVVSEIVLKLLAKNPTDRYQSASGIQADLQACLQQVQDHRPVRPLELAQQDGAVQWTVAGSNRNVATPHAHLDNQLELRVQQRTAELVQTNQQLERQVQEFQRSEQILRLIVEGTAAVIGKDFFRSLVHSLAKALNVRYAFITECDRTTPNYFRAIACWYQDAFGENFEYDVHGTPCEWVISGQRCQCYPNQLRSLFPEDDSLAELQAQSYAAVALLDSTGRLLGHLAVLDDRPIETVSRNMAILEIFAARAAAEMERQQTEAATRLSEEKFAKAFRASPNGITITTIKEGRFIEVNDSFLRMLGYSREEVIGQSSLQLDIWANPADRQVITQQLQTQGTASNLEVELRRKSGEKFLALVSGELIDLAGEPCLLGVTTDITVLKQAAKALERLAEIGELASMIVHEVRNPLATLLMGLNSFKRLELPDRFREYLTLALEEGDRLQRLLNQILLYAKPQRLDRTALELNQFISDTLHPLRELPVAITKQLQFTSAYPTAAVLADRDKLKQVLINLIVNACEAAAEGTTITVSLQIDRANQVNIQVHNPGEPIPPEVLAKLTQPFFTTKSSGNGLGLAIVKRILEAHAGELRIDSSALGTTVTVSLPLQG